MGAFMGKKVLTIDDSQTVRTIIAKHLSQFSVQVYEAENGRREWLAPSQHTRSDLAGL